MSRRERASMKQANSKLAISVAGSIGAEKFKGADG